MVKVKINGVDFDVKKSTRKNKKYDVFFKDHYILSFGDSRYQHFHDRIGMYSHLNHNDQKRKDNYFKRHGHTDDIFSAKFWSNSFLW